MPAFQGTYFSKTLTLKQSDGTPLNITGWALHMQVRVTKNDAAALLDLTSDNEGVVVTDGSSGQMQIRLTADDTALLPVGKVVFDVLRTDADPGPVWLFGGYLPVRKPVTRE